MRVCVYERERGKEGKRERERKRERESMSRRCRGRGGENLFTVSVKPHAGLDLTTLVIMT